MHGTSPQSAPLLTITMMRDLPPHGVPQPDLACHLYLRTPHEIVGAPQGDPRATLLPALYTQHDLAASALSGCTARVELVDPPAPTPSWTTALIPALAIVGAPGRVPRLLAALASLPLAAGGKRKPDFYAFYAPETGCGVYDSWQLCSKWCTGVTCNFNRGCASYEEACEAAARAAGHFGWTPEIVLNAAPAHLVAPAPTSMSALAPTPFGATAISDALAAVAAGPGPSSYAPTPASLSTPVHRRRRLWSSGGTPPPECPPLPPIVAAAAAHVAIVADTAAAAACLLAAAAPAAHTPSPALGDIASAASAAAAAVLGAAGDATAVPAAIPPTAATAAAAVPTAAAAAAAAAAARPTVATGRAIASQQLYE